MTNIEKIRQEIERLKGVCVVQIKANPGQTFPFIMEMTGYDKLLAFIDSLPEEPDKSLEAAAKTNAKINMTRTKLELNEIETLIHLVRARAVEPGHFQGLYKNILSRLNKMFDEEYAGIEK